MLRAWSADAVSDEFAHDAVAVTFDEALNRIGDIPHPIAGFGKGDGVVQCSRSRVDHFGGFFGDRLDQHRGGVVTDKPL